MPGRRRWGAGGASGPGIRRMGRPDLEEPLMSRPAGALRLFGFGRVASALRRAREFRRLEQADGADLAVGRARGQPICGPPATRSWRGGSRLVGRRAPGAREALGRRSMTSFEPGRDGSTACCATMRAARRAGARADVTPRPPSPAERIDPSPVERGNTRGSGRSRGGEAGWRPEPAGAPPARRLQVAASARALGADWRRAPI